MSTSPKFLLLPLAATLALAACGSSSKTSSTTAATTAASSSEASAAIVKMASNAALGATVLTDAQGMTLYSLSGEQNGKFICTSATCLKNWPPLRASAAGTPSGSVGSLGTVKRPDGSEQVTYKGMPLYTFAADQKPGDAGGQGVKDLSSTWTAVTSAAGATSEAQTQSTPAAPAKSGGSYAY
jgi:predicted lipoprotein with Yx(FWY)xxD motif